MSEICVLGTGMAGYGARRSGTPLKALHDKPLFEPAYYFRRALKLLEVCRQELGGSIKIRFAHAPSGPRDPPGRIERSGHRK